MRTVSTIGHERTLAIAHVVPPIAKISLLIIFVEMLTLSVPRILLPVTDVELFVVVKAFPVSAISRILFPMPLVLVTRGPFSVSAYIGTLAIALLLLVYVAFICVAISILNPYHVPARLRLFGKATQLAHF